MRPEAAVVTPGLPSVALFSLDGSVHSAGRTDVDAQLILDSMPHVVWTASPDGVTMSLNPRGIAYTGPCLAPGAMAVG